MIESLFWICLALLVYTYFLYPIIIYVLGLFFSKPVKKSSQKNLSVSLIIAAYNEEKEIENKIKNSLKLDYPNEFLEIMIVSDGSTDKTDDIAKRYIDDGIKLLRVEGRKGKTFAQNEAVKAAKGEIILFSDATTIYETDVVRYMIEPFADSTVGCVSGKLSFKNREDSKFHGEKNIAERYDQAIKKIESDIYSIYGVNGCLYAMRKDLYIPIEPYLTSDFVAPLKIVEKGFRVVFEPRAISYEEPCKNASGEFKRKIRTSRAGINGMYHMIHMLNPLKYFWCAFGLLNHKILRWLSPYLILSVMFLNMALCNMGEVYCYLLLAQIAFYFCAIMGFLNEKTNKKIKLFTIPFNFLLINAAAIIGFIQFLFGNIGESWETNRE